MLGCRAVALPGTEQIVQENSCEYPSGPYSNYQELLNLERSGMFLQKNLTLMQ